MEYHNSKHLTTKSIVKLNFTIMKTITLITASMALGAGVFFNTVASKAPENGSLKGIITEHDAGEAIPFAAIFLVDSLHQTISLTSNFDGKFEVPDLNPGTYSIAVRFIGFENYSNSNIIIKTDNVTSLSISLRPKSIELDQLEIVQYNLSEDAAEAEELRIESGIKIYSSDMKKAPNRNSNNITQTATWGYTVGNASSPSYGWDDKAMANESYSENSENEFKYSMKDPLSTFSIDVDAASYSNVRRMINQGYAPQKDAVRVEEMINYFSYDYPGPKGNNPFSISTEVSDCPWNEQHQLVHIGLQGKKISTDNLPPSNLVFLIDVSGSMGSYNKLPLLKKSFALLVDQLRPEDRVAIVVYAGAAGCVLESTSGKEKGKILGALEKLQSGGSTAGGAGINLAYKIALDNFSKVGNNRVILATDGDFNVGATSDNDMEKLIEEKRKSGVFLTVLGFGMGNYKDSKMETIADKGNGNYAYIDNIMEAKKVFVNELGATMFTIAKDVKIQVEFNPAKVSYYKLIGYENRMLAAEDFNDDTKDAGELGAGHTVTALYEIVPVSIKSNIVPSIDPLKYQKVEEAHTLTGSDELLTVKFRYKDPNGTKSKLIIKELYDKSVKLYNASNNFKHAAAVAEFGLLLRDSKYKSSSNYAQVIKLAKSAKGIDEYGYRTEFIRLAETMELLADQ